MGKTRGTQHSYRGIHDSIRTIPRWSAFWSLDKIWYSQSIRLHLKLHLFRIIFLSILLCSCQAWIISKDTGAKLNVFFTSRFRIVLNIKRLDYSQMTDFTAGQAVGHILRMEKDEPANIYAWHELSYRRRTSERPWRSFRYQVREWIVPNISSQRMTSCELPKTDPVGHALQLTVPQPTTIIMIKGMKVLGERVQGDVRVKGAIRVVGYT